MGVLGSQDTVGTLARADSICRYGHVLRRGEDDVLGRALDFKIKWWKRNKKKWRRQVEEKLRNLV